MSKDRKTETEPQQESTNGVPAPAAEPPKKRRVLSTPLQAMSVIEREMDRLTDHQKNTVAAWFIATYWDRPEPGEV